LNFNFVYLTRIVVVRHIQLVWNLLLIWFVKLKHMHGNVWNVKHVQNVEILKMIQNFYFVMAVIGQFLFHLSYLFNIFVLVVITCIAVHHLYQKHLMVTGDVNYVVLNLANIDLDLFGVFLYLCMSICLFIACTRISFSSFILIL
jgi:hypothetical protein